VASPSDYLPDLAYPHILEGLLQARYTSQTIAVVPLGAYGRSARESYEDLRGALLKGVPDALLILSGVNDINSGDPASILVVQDGLRSSIRIAKSSGVQIIFLSTLLPQTTGQRAYAPQLIAPANTMIRALAASEGVVLVDNYAALVTQATLYIGADGLHPSAAGHQKIAETFFESIKTNYEVPVAASVSRVRR
jgi:lysophospholipase L1-like esterase